MRKVHTQAGVVAYEDIGQGSTVVLLHATLHDHRDFEPIIPALAKEHRVVAIDWPGHGESDAHSAVTAALLADVLQEIVTTLELEPAVIIGNSVGGFAAARLAIEHPDRVAGLVLVNTGGFIKPSPLTRIVCRTLGTPSIARRMAPVEIRSYMKATSENDKAVIARVQQTAKTPSGIQTFTSLWRSFNDPGYDLRERADQIKAPTLIVWGSRDPVLPLRFGKTTHKAIPGSRLEVLKTGHLVFSSAPQDFLEIVEPFIRSAHDRPIARGA